MDETLKTRPKRKRRWVSFGLRTLLVVVTAFSVWLAWWIPKKGDSRNRHRGIFESWSHSRRLKKLACVVVWATAADFVSPDLLSKKAIRG